MILAAVAQQVIGRHSLYTVFQINLEILAYSFSRIAACVVSNKGKVPKGSCGVPLLKVLL